MVNNIMILSLLISHKEYSVIEKDTEALYQIIKQLITLFRANWLETKAVLPQHPRANYS